MRYDADINLRPNATCLLFALIQKPASPLVFLRATWSDRITFGLID
jgi:hypothetical protein